MVEHRVFCTLDSVADAIESCFLAGGMDFLRILWGYWWLRGVAAALGLLLFIREFFGYSLFETAGAILATFALWEDALGWVGLLIGRLPFIPPLTSDQTLYLSLILTFSVPAGASAVSDLGNLLNASKRQIRSSQIDSELDEIDGRNGVRVIARRRALRREQSKLRSESNVLEVVLGLLLLVAAGGSTGLLIVLAIVPELEFGRITTAAIAVSVGVAFALACRLRGYLVGAVTLLGVLLALQGAYLLDAPWVREYVRNSVHAPTSE